jgi:hypothetical protein
MDRVRRSRVMRRKASADWPRSPGNPGRTTPCPSRQTASDAHRARWNLLPQNLLHSGSSNSHIGRENPTAPCTKEGQWLCQAARGRTSSANSQFCAGDIASASTRFAPAVTFRQGGGRFYIHRVQELSSRSGRRLMVRTVPSSFRRRGALVRVAKPPGICCLYRIGDAPTFAALCLALPAPRLRDVGAEGTSHRAEAEGRSADQPSPPRESPALPRLAGFAHRQKGSA